MKKTLSPIVLSLIACLLSPGLPGGPNPLHAQTAQAERRGSKLNAEQRRWAQASPHERQLLAQRIGENGARHYAKLRGWQVIDDGLGQTRFPQGIDMVYRARDGWIHAVEAKGGSSPLGRGYGQVQGSPQWAVKAAKAMLESPATSQAQRRGALLVLRAAVERRLQVDVLRTRHIYGKPVQTLIEKSAAASDDVARSAVRALNELSQRGLNRMTHPAHGQASQASAQRTATRGTPRSQEVAKRTAEQTAKQASRLSKATRVASKAAVPLAVATDAGMRGYEVHQTEQQVRRGQISRKEANTRHAGNAAGMAGGWAGAWAGAQLGASGGAAAGTCVAPGPGTAIGSGVGAVVGGVAGYFAGERAAKESAEWVADWVQGD